ncbi:MAG: Hsp20/alpha crystallin family protein [Elusimicrobiota bacterium]
MPSGIASWGPDALIGRTRLPDMEIAMTAHGYTLSMELPELSKEDILVRVSGGALHVSSIGFQRSFHIPAGVGAKDVKAAYKNGVLSLAVPNRGRRSGSIGKVKVE